VKINSYLSVRLTFQTIYGNNAFEGFLNKGSFWCWDKLWILVLGKQ
jgi:hypothetical protein